MSLIIASNVNLTDRPGTSEIHKAYSWSNRLTSTFKIETDSEIAVQSVKLNKSGLLSVGQYNSNYALYFGSDIVDTAAVKKYLQDSVNHPVADSVVRGSGIKDLTVDEYGREIEKSFQKNVMNPGFYDPTTKVPSVTVVPKLVAGAFAGYTFAATQSALPLDVIPPDASAQSLFPTTRFTYVGGVMTRVASSGGDVDGTPPTGCCAMFLDKPVLLSSPDTKPSVNYDITGAVGDGSGGALNRGTWACGLSRNNTQSFLISPTTEDNIGFAPPYYDPNNSGSDSFVRFKYMCFDFCAVKDKNGMLKIFQSCVDTSSISGDQLVMREVVYVHPLNPIFKNGLYDLNVNATKYTNLRFRVENEGVVCEIGVGGSWDIVVDTKLGVKQNMFYPRSVLQNFLYPQIYIGIQGTAISIAERFTYSSIPDKFDPASSDVDFVARLESTGNYIKWGKPIENRDHNNFSLTQVTDPTAVFPYETFEPYAGATGGWLKGTQMNLIMAPNVDYGVEYTADANTQYSFGFNGRSLATGGPVDANGGSTFESSVAPILTSSKSLFVRVNNLTQQSVNAQLGNAYSKIIGHLPRFDSAGNELGHLYFEPNSKTYLALNNVQPLYLNSFDIDLVYDNETYADSLSGKTIVVLHIRKRGSS